MCDGASGTRSGATRYFRGVSIDDLIKTVLINTAGRPVINKTGITGLFDIHLEYSPDQNSDAPDAAPSIFEALQQQLGLKLVPAKGPGEFLVTDRLERPSDN